MGRLRHSTQFLAFVLVNIGFIQILKTGVVCPFFYCYACPVAAFACPIGVFQSYAAVGQFPFYAIGTLGVFALALGRFWCGWGCPFGTVQDLVMWARRRGDFVSLPRFGWARLVVLAGAILAAWLAVDTLFCKVCPAGSLFGAIPQRLASPELSFGVFFWVHIGTLVAALVAFFLIGRVWCRYICPLGGILGLFNRVSLLKLKVDRNKCTDCRDCLEVCPTRIDKLQDVGDSSDCIRCGKCIDACPAGAIRIAPSVRR
jgi:polyferredoxin